MTAAKFDLSPERRRAHEMRFGEHLRRLREAKGLSQGEMQERTGLFRCYISRVENGHTIPGIPTLEKWAQGLEVPLYRLFCDDGEPAQPYKFSSATTTKELLTSSTGKERRFLEGLRGAIRHMDDRDLRLLLFLAKKLSKQP